MNNTINNDNNVFSSIELSSGIHMTFVEKVKKSNKEFYKYRLTIKNNNVDTILYLYSDNQMDLEKINKEQLSNHISLKISENPNNQNIYIGSIFVDENDNTNISIDPSSQQIFAAKPSTSTSRTKNDEFAMPNSSKVECNWDYFAQSLSDVITGKSNIN